VKPYTPVFFRGMRHGLLGAVALPTEPEPVPSDVLDRLHPEERKIASELAGFRQVQWVGGRLAAREAASRLGLGMGALKTDNFGAPKAPRNIAVSLAHKKHLAVALVARSKHGALGVDFELTAPPRIAIAEKVLRPAEMAQVNALTPDRRWISVLIRFSIKEAIYKAIAPRLRRYISFDEAEVTPHLDGTAHVELHLKSPVAPAQLEAEYVWIDDGLVSTVRVRWPEASAESALPD
jgi:phosphopantetheine--protein transferase-like protein